MNAFTRIGDSLLNLVSRLGTTYDKNSYNQYQFNPLDRGQLETAFRGDWIARKIVCIPAQDATREWRMWQAEDAQIELIEKEEERLDLQRKTKSAMTRARLYGASALVMGFGDVPSQPLEVERVKKGDLKHLNVVSRHEMSAGSPVRDVTSPYFGHPEMYTVMSESAGIVSVHPSRVIRFLGSELPDSAMITDGWPADSVLQAVDDAIKNVAVTSTSVAALVNESKMDILKIPNFMSSVGTQDYRDRMVQRLSLVNTSKSMMSTILTDKEEEWSRITASFSHLPEILQLYLLIACGAADIPATRFLGQSAPGMNSTGESDVRNYYDSVSSHQRTELGPSMRLLDEVLLRSTLGSRPPEVYYEWCPLWQMDSQQKAAVSLQKAQAFQVDVSAGLMNPEALAKARFNQLVEDGVYPGLEEAMAAEDNDGILEYDPEAQAQFAESGGEGGEGGDAGGGRDGDGDGRVGAAELNDYEPRTLYVRRDVVNADEIVAWAKGAGIASTIPAEKMHVTVVFSRAKVDWMKIREDGYCGPASSTDAPEGGLVVAPGGPRLVERLGATKDAVVLMFNSSHLCWRHESIQEGGASWDWPEYQPHVTVSFDAPDVDVSKIEPYRGRIVLGPEVFEEVNEKWKEGVKES